MATSDPATLETLSAPLRQVLEALVEGLPAPPDALAALTESERAEIAALARTAHFVRSTLQSPAPSGEAEAASLVRAREAFAKRGFPVGDGGTSPAPPRPALLAWLDRLRRKPE